MARIGLLDVNVLIALFNADHVHHQIAHDWFAEHRGDGWATCAITENGFVRVMAQLMAAEPASRPSVVVDHLQRFCADRRHRFWADDISITDKKLFNHSLLRGHSQLTDIYLLGLATAKNGRLVTFDATIPLNAVISARREHLAVLADA